MVRTHGQGTIYHGEDAARTAGALWRDGDVFVVKTTGASYVRTDGAWVQISVGGGTEDHESLSGLLGGAANDHYHLTGAQHDDLTDGGDTTLHVHDAYIANALLTAQGDLLVRNGTVPARLALVVPDAPTINFLGVANGETDPSWKSASSAPGAAASVLQTKATGELRLGAVLQIVGDTFPTDGAGLELGGNEWYSVIESINRDTSTGMPIYFNYGITGDMIFNAGASSGNVQIGDTQNRGTTVSTKAVNIFDGTAPVGTLANGFTLYSSGGSPYVMDAAGTARNLITDYVPASTLDAQTILYAVTDNTPAALSVGASTVVGRKDTGDIVALNASEGRTVLGLGTMATEAAADYIANALLTTRGDIIRRGASAPERYGLVVPVSPTINFLGVANGETDPTWKSASSAGAADAHVVATDASGYTQLVRLGIGVSPTSAVHLGYPGTLTIDTYNNGAKYRIGGLSSIFNWGGTFLNASFNGASWDLDDTSYDGWFFKLDARVVGSSPYNGMTLYRIPAGANPHTDEYPAFSITDGYSHFRDNIKIAGTAVRGTTEGTNHLDIFDGTAPAGTLANGCSIYSTAGELRVQDAAGNATLISPHDDDGYWIFDSQDTVTGRRLRIDVEKMLRAINERFGWDFIQEFAGA